LLSISQMKQTEPGRSVYLRRLCSSRKIDSIHEEIQYREKTFHISRAACILYSLFDVNRKSNNFSVPERRSSRNFHGNSDLFFFLLPSSLTILYGGTGTSLVSRSTDCRTRRSSRSGSPREPIRRSTRGSCRLLCRSSSSASGRWSLPASYPFAPPWASSCWRASPAARPPTRRCPRSTRRPINLQLARMH